MAISSIGIVLGIAGSIADGVEKDTVDFMSTCVYGPSSVEYTNNLTYYGSSSFYLAAEQCYQGRYSAGYDCDCVQNVRRIVFFSFY